MSVESWKAEFYPTKAREVKTALEAIEHSLRKWRGAKAEALARHKVAYAGHQVYDQEDNFEFDWGSCALCQVFLLKTRDCKGCPLLKETCRSCGMIRSVYELGADDPRPVIEALEACLTQARKEEEEKKAETLEEVLMRRDGMTREEAEAELEEVAGLVREGADPEEVLREELGLEPDYVFDLLRYCK